MAMCLTMGAQRRSGWLPSRKAVCDPSASLMKRFIAVSTTDMESLSGSMKSRALPMAMKISSLTRGGIPYLSMNSETDSSSCRSMNGWPSISMGSSAGTICTFSAHVNISVFRRIASAMPNGAGTPGVNLKKVKVPGFSRIAKAMRCSFHCSRSWMPSSVKRFIMFG